MNLQNVLKVARKEMKETLRDRRTMIMMVLIPVFLDPVLFIFLQQLALIGQRSIEEEPVTVVVSGGGAEHFGHHLPHRGVVVGKEDLAHRRLVWDIASVRVQSARPTLP